MRRTPRPGRCTYRTHRVGVWSERRAGTERDAGAAPRSPRWSEAGSVGRTEAPRASQLQQPHRPRPLTCERLEQLQHPCVVATRFARQRPAHEVRKMEVTDAHGIGIAECRAGGLGGRPWTDARDGHEARERADGRQAPRVLEPCRRAPTAPDDVGSPLLEADRMELVVGDPRQRRRLRREPQRRPGRRGRRVLPWPRRRHAETQDDAPPCPMCLGARSPSARTRPARATPAPGPSPRTARPGSGWPAAAGGDAGVRTHPDGRPSPGVGEGSRSRAPHRDPRRVPRSCRRAARSRASSGRAVSGCAPHTAIHEPDGGVARAMPQRGERAPHIEREARAPGGLDGHPGESAT